MSFVARGLSHHAHCAHSIVGRSFLRLLRGCPFPGIAIATVYGGTRVAQTAFCLRCVSVCTLLSTVLRRTLRLSRGAGPSGSLTSFLCRTDRSGRDTSFVGGGCAVLPIYRHVTSSPYCRTLFSSGALKPCVLRCVFARRGARVVSFLRGRLRVSTALTRGLCLFLIDNFFAVGRRRG